MMFRLSQRLLVLIGLLTLSFMSHAQSSGSTVQRVEFFSETLQRTYQYQVYLPVDYANSDRLYSVVYLLHGRGDTMDAWLHVRQALDNLIESGDIPPLIAIMPDMPSNDRASYYIDSQYTGNLYRAEAVETAFFQDLIPHIDTTYRTIQQRQGRIIAGYSMGGYGAIRYSLVYPEMFMGAIVLSPAVYTPLPPADSSTREFGAFGVGNRLFDNEIYQSLNYPAVIQDTDYSPTPLFMFIAVGDQEWKHPDPADHLHDIDMESHLLFNRVVRVDAIQSEFRVYGGGHDWQVWEKGFIEGIQYIGRLLE